MTLSGAPTIVACGTLRQLSTSLQYSRKRIYGFPYFSKYIATTSKQSSAWSKQKTKLEIDLLDTHPKVVESLTESREEAPRFKRVWRKSPFLRKKDRLLPIATYTLPDVGLTSAQLSALAGVPVDTVFNCAKQLDSNVHDKSAVLSPEVVELVSDELSLRVAFRPQTVPLLSERLKPSLNATNRAPVITVMGHVDHGKTTLLDALRKTDVAKHEAGGITQSVAAFQVSMGLQGKNEDNLTNVTFIDTPGHAAFSTMRTNGAIATDIIVLVVAADDGVKPQTVEVARLARACNVPVIVAINKCDKSSADPDRVRYELLQEADINTETLGGMVQSVEISAKTGKGLDDLLEAISVQAEILELKSDAEETGSGICLESRLDRSFGNVATVIVKNGTFSKGDFIAFHSGLVLHGALYGRVRLLVSADGTCVPNAGPGSAVGIVGIKEPIPPGCQVAVMENERAARSKSHDVIVRNIEAVGTIQKANRLLAELNEKDQRGIDKIPHGDTASKTHRSEQDSEQDVEIETHRRQLVVVVKADVKGSAEAVAQCIQRFSDDKVNVKIVSMGVGDVSDTDVMTASVGKKLKDHTREYIIAAFNVRVKESMRKAARLSGIRIVEHSIIYHLEDEVGSILERIKDKATKKETIVGTANVSCVFESGTIAGSRIEDGKISVGSVVKVLRLPDDIEQDRIREEIFRGEVESIRQHAKDVKTIKEGSECGIVLKGWSSFRSGDQILAVEISGDDSGT